MSFSLEYSSVAVAEAIRAVALLIHAILSWILASLDLRPQVSGRSRGSGGCSGPSRSAVREIKRCLPVSTYGDLLAAYGEENDHAAGYECHGDHHHDSSSSSSPCCKGSSSSASAVTCAVCLNALRRSDEVRELHNCRHVFHRGCLDRWLDHDENGGTCPLCRAPLIHRPALSSASDSACPPPPPGPYSGNSWAVDRLIYLFADDVLMAGGISSSYASF